MIRGQRLSQALDFLNLSVDEAAELFDQRRHRVIEWLHGEKRTPSWAFVILTLLTLPGGRDLARAALHTVNEEEHNADA